LDLQSAEDRSKVYEILRGCDVVISNFKHASAVKMAMDYDTVKKLNPTIIYGQIYGLDEADETPAFDVVLQAEAGFMYMTGERGRKAVKMPVAMVDLLAAHQLKEGILIALLEKARTGKGAFVSTSLYEAAVASLANQATNWLMAGHIPQRIGSEHPNIAPYGDVFTTLDNKEIVVACGTERQWQNLCTILGMEKRIADKRFETNALRVKNRPQLVKILRGVIKGYNRDNLLEILRGAQIPAGGIRTMREVFETQAAQNMVLTEPLTETFVTKRVKTVAFKIFYQD
jgi:crotonobetainyl-CoA:carnitine CoA-transferase CaiB-like acyl-CoA transferase